MGNSHPSRQPPVDAPGTAVLYIRGFSYASKQPCGCVKPELLGTTSGGSHARLDTSSLPQELAGCGITPQEFADNCARIDDKAKKFVSAGSLSLRAIAVPILVTLVGLVITLIGLRMCDDASPKDYWRDECVQTSEDCATRELNDFDDYYPSCRAVCNAESAAASTISPGCPSGDLGCPLDGNVDNTPCLTCPTVESEELTRGCHCVPSEDVRRIKCSTKKGKKWIHGCREFQYTRVCDDQTHPMMYIGWIAMAFGQIFMFGYYMYVACVLHPAVNNDLETLCRTLTSESRMGIRWEYVVFTQGQGKGKQHFKCIVVQSPGGQPMAVAQTMQTMQVMLPAKGS